MPREKWCRWVRKLEPNGDTKLLPNKGPNSLFKTLDSQNVNFEGLAKARKENALAELPQSDNPQPLYDASDMIAKS
jgi:hypothetical protein